MFGLRCLMLVFLIIALVAAVFYVQEAKADECQTALQACYDAALYEALVCSIYGSNHKLCIQAKGTAASKCLQAVIICEN